MAVTENTFTGNGSTTTYSFTFEYLKTTDIKASINGVATTAFTLPTATSLQFNTAPANSSAIRIYRDTNTDTLSSTFYAGSSIKSQDLNDNFLQNLYTTQETKNLVDTSWQVGDETIISTETWHTSDDTRIGTTKAIENRINSQIDTAIEGDIIAGTDLTKTTSSGQVTINHSISGASSVDNVNGNVIQDLTINGRGHVTGHASVDLDTRYYTETELNNGQLDSRYYTETELNNGQLDSRYYTETEVDTNFYKLGSVAEIQSGETWAAADNKIATTSAIDARIVDLVDDVGGFVPIANETSFPNANPDVNNGAGTLISIKALSSNLTSNGSGVATIANGTVGNSTVTITGLANSTTYSSGYGLIVETTSTLNTYTFHRQVPIATEITTVASNITNINTVAGNNTNINTVAGANSNISTVATNISNVNNVGGSIANVNTVATNISGVNDFAARYRVASSAPGSNNDEGDLYFDTTANELKVYNGSAWQGGVTATGSLAGLAANTFTGNQSHGDDVKNIFGTGNDLEIFHNGTDSIIDNNTGILKLTSDNTTIFDKEGSDVMAKFLHDGACELYHDNSKKIETIATGVSVTGNLVPAATNTHDLGTSSLRWDNLYVNDLHFSNHPDNPNSVDGTWGNWTLQEGENDIYMLNNRTGKKYKMALTEVS